MSIALKMGSGAAAGVIAGVLVVAFWPHHHAEVRALKPSVEKPVFVIETAPASPPPSSVVVAKPVTPPPPPAPTSGTAAMLKPPAAAPAATPPAAPSPPAAPAAVNVSSATPEASRLFAQGLAVLANGDLDGARKWLERAGDAGDARAWMALGVSYDPATIAKLGVVGAPGDAGRARDYYNRALAAGVSGAAERIAALDVKPN